MCEAAQFFEQALAEEGLDAQVSTTDDDAHLGLSKEFIITKKIAGENLSMTVRTREAATTPLSNQLKKELAQHAKQVAMSFKDHLVDTLQWQNNAIELSVYDDPYAECQRCGTRTSLNSVQPMLVQSAELATPNPSPYETKSIIERMDDHSEVCLKMYLVGKLRQSCGPDCPTSKHSIF